MSATYQFSNGLDTDLSHLKNGNKKAATARASLKLLTQNDSKILGNYSKKLAKTAPPKQFTTSQFKTIKSNFTPNFSKTSNEQIFKERRELVSNWFDSWSDSQRRRFLDTIFKQCRKAQLHFVQKWFNDHVPLRHVDPTKVLPRFLTLYIFSFLDPRSLCRASAVSWHWKFLAEQDCLWIPKCLKQGWFLPYDPEENEYGAWKQHYVACLHTLDIDVIGQKASGLYGGVGDGSRAKQRRDKQKVISLRESQEVLEIRPPWQPPDKIPRDLDTSAKALYEGLNPNDPVLPKALLLHHNKWGVRRAKTSESTPNFSQTLAEVRDPNPTVTSVRTMSKSMDALDLRTGRKQALSEVVGMESLEERRLMELVAQPWDPPSPAKLPVSQNPKIKTTASYSLPWKEKAQPMSKAYLHEKSPRVIFISSRVPAADVLVDAVNFGIIPIVYEYEGATLESLIVKLDRCLQGRNAQSIGLFAHSQEPGALCLVHGSTVTVDNLDTPDVLEFFQSLSSHIVPTSDKGHCDIFVPLGSTEMGTEMLIQLNVLTGITFTSPTGIIGNYNHINSEWMRTPEVDSPPSHYFCAPKLNVWVNTADQVKEACSFTKKIIGRYFEQKHRDVVSQVAGQVVFDAVGQTDITGVGQVTETLIEGLLALGHAQNVKPLEFLGSYLLEKAGRGDMTFFDTDSKQKAGDTLKMGKTLDANTLSAALTLNEKFEDSLQNSINDEGEQIHDKDAKEKSNMEAYEETLADELTKEESIPEEVEEIIEGDMIMKPKPVQRTLKTVTMKSEPEFQSSSSSFTMDSTSVRRMGPLTISGGPQAHSTMMARMPTGTAPPRPLSAQQFKDHPEKRTPIAEEILASEINYMRILDIFRNKFHTPINAALASNRAILSAQNTQIIFSDILTLGEISRDLVEDLKSRLSTWSSQSCLGDIFCHFATTFKAYVNYLNNYPLILDTLERAMEHTPMFRAFLKRHERRPETKMMTLAELFLVPTRRIGQYVTLLTWFKTYTQPEHTDHQDLNTAIRKVTQLNNLIQQNRERLEKERELLDLQKRITRCPVLMEANRYFLLQLDAAHLKPPSSGAILPELRTYQHIEMLGLFLFNDSMLVTRRTTHNFPYERSVEMKYQFEACAALNRLRVEDIPDSKYVKNAFRMYTPRRSWICSTDTPDDKANWISLLENSIRACLATK